MGLSDVFKIGGMALNSQRTRMEVISSNLANSQTTRTEDGGPYRKKDVVFRSESVDKGSAFSRIMDKQIDIDSVKVEEIRNNTKEPEKIFNPGHPDADEKGYVLFPNVNIMEEMADMTAASRAYEANINIINTTKEMMIKALEIGK